MVRVCVDVMGGDDAVGDVLAGIGLALDADPALELLAAGDADAVVPFAEGRDRVEPLATTEVIGMGEHPAEAVRRKRDSSIVRGLAAVRAGDADGFFSAGSTGAVLAAATLGVGRVRGIMRPAITIPFPGLDGHETVLLDAGANADCRPEMLVQFAHMGSAYATAVLGVERPRVALLSNGTEDAKGSEAAIAAHEALAAADGIEFAGNCEGNDILLGGHDVIVCDGFTGNVALKSLEGTAKFIVSELKRLVRSSARATLGGLLLKPALSELRERMSGDARGGAVLLGVKAPVFIGHGATSAEAVKNGALAVAEAVREDLVARIAERVA